MQNWIQLCFSWMIRLGLIKAQDDKYQGASDGSHVIRRKARVIKLSPYKREAAFRQYVLKLLSYCCSVGELFISCSIPGRMLLTASHLTVWVPPASIKTGIAMWCLCGRFTSCPTFKSFESKSNTEPKKENIYCLWMWCHTGPVIKEQGGEVLVWGLWNNPASPLLFQQAAGLWNCSHQEQSAHSCKSDTLQLQRTV